MLMCTRRLDRSYQEHRLCARSSDACDRRLVQTTISVSGLFVSGVSQVIQIQAGKEMRRMVRNPIGCTVHILTGRTSIEVTITPLMFALSK